MQSSHEEYLLTLKRLPGAMSKLKFFHLLTEGTAGPFATLRDPARRAALEGELDQCTAAIGQLWDKAGVDVHVTSAQALP